jgi:NAD+ diphosphatase
MASTNLNIFAGLSLILDRVSEQRDDADWIAAKERSPDARFILIDLAGDAFLQRDDEALRWLNAREREHLLPHASSSLLGIANDQPHFMLLLDDSHDAAALESSLHARRIGLREAGLQLSADEAGFFAYAKGLAHWQRETRRCSYCGSPVERVSSGHRMHCTNPACGRVHFPRTDAAIIVIVEYQGACLLGRQAVWPPGRYSTLAGFIEPGEALEDAVRREVAEESGVIVGDVHYQSSQPWPMPASLMIGFSATALSPDIHLRDGELEDARWFTPQQIVDGLADGSLMTPTKLSVSYQLIAHWLRERAGLDLDALVARAPPQR